MLNCPMFSGLLSIPFYSQSFPNLLHFSVSLFCEALTTRCSRIFEFNNNYNVFIEDTAHASVMSASSFVALTATNQVHCNCVVVGDKRMRNFDSGKNYRSIKQMYSI